MKRTRDPADVARFVTSIVALALVALVRFERPSSLRNVSADVVRLAARLPNVLQIAVVGTTQLIALGAAIAVAVLAVVRRRWSVLVPALVGAAGAGALSALAAGWISHTAPPTELYLPRPTWIIGPSFPSASYLAAVVAMVVVASPTWTRQWRRAAWIAVSVIALSRVLTAVTVPVGIGAAVLLGTTVGSAVLLIVGIPRLRPSLAQVRSELATLGITVDSVGPAPFESVGQSKYVADRADHRGRIEISVIDRNNRDADVFARVVRSLRVRGSDEEQAGLSPVRIAEHTALVTLMAQTHGTPVESVVAVGETSDGAGLIAVEASDGQRLGTLDSGAITDEMLSSAWGALSQMHSVRIAHRRANLNHVLATADGPDGTPGVIWTGLRQGSLGASDRLIALDIAELLISSALKVGLERAVDAAVSQVPAERLVSSLPFIQTIVLTPSTRRLLGKNKALVEETRELLQSRLDAEPFELAPVQRITPARLVGLLAITVLAYTALGFASNLSDIGEALGRTDWSYVPALAVFAALNYPMLALSMAGAVPGSIPFLQTTVVSLAQTLLNRFTPANAGGMALRMRYMQRLGIEVEVAATSLGLTSAAGGVTQVLLLIMFGVWAGSAGELSFKLPTSLIAPVLLLLLVAGAGIYLTPWGRRTWSNKVIPSAQRTWPVIRELLRSPSKLTLLLSSTAAAKLFTIAAFAVSVRAVGLDLSFAQLGLLYMTANTVASAAPTPGGLGAIEAALTAALTSTGAPAAEALSAVLVFRLATFWAPIPFSAVALSRVRKQGLV